MTDAPLFLLPQDPPEPDHLTDRIPQPRLFHAEAEPTEE